MNVDHVNLLGWTALLEAIMLGDGHANVDLPDSNGVTPLRHAQQRGYGAIGRVLVAAGAR